MDKILQDFDALLEGGDRLYSSEEYEDALDAYERSLRAASDDTQRAESYCALGDALLALGRGGEAIFMYEKAVDLDADFAGGYCGQADVHFERWEFQHARELLALALARDPDYARAHYLYGLILEVRRAQGGAPALPQGERSIPSTTPRPSSSIEEFAPLVSQALRGLPSSARKLVANVAIELRLLPDPEDAPSLRELDISPQVPALLYESVEPADPLDPTDSMRLVLFQRNIEKLAASREAIVAEVQKGIMYELSDIQDDHPDDDEVTSAGPPPSS
ncbi:MAG: tetratricopeptide repeat protein [Acidobacteriota bacterium]